MNSKLALEFYQPLKEDTITTVSGYMRPVLGSRHARGIAAISLKDCALVPSTQKKSE
jgi:hypothetical protein